MLWKCLNTISHLTWAQQVFLISIGKHVLQPSQSLYCQYQYSFCFWLGASCHPSLHNSRAWHFSFYIVIATDKSRGGSFYDRLYINPQPIGVISATPVSCCLAVLWTPHDMKTQSSLVPSHWLSLSPSPLSKVSACTSTAIISRQDLALYPSATSATLASLVLSAGQPLNLQT